MEAIIAKRKVTKNNLKTGDIITHKWKYRGEGDVRYLGVDATDKDSGKFQYVNYTKHKNLNGGVTSISFSEVEQWFDFKS